IYLYGGASGNYQRPEVTYQGDIIAQAITLDEYVAKHQLDVGLIKVDIEGTEREFLKGAKQTIMSKRPILLISIYHTADDFLDI
ncbi:MAG TPA: hypothetical protein DCZ10_09055, partial [Pelotomaculum sp.]|nr:hypothetical protein [Pelotomaculum sp.]